MKTRTVREFRGQISTLLDGEESVLLTRRGKPAGVLYPLANPTKLPAEVRRSLYLELSSRIADELDAKGVTEDMLQRDFEDFRQDRRSR